MYILQTRSSVFYLERTYNTCRDLLIAWFQHCSGLLAKMYSTCMHTKHNECSTIWMAPMYCFCSTYICARFSHTSGTSAVASLTWANTSRASRKYPLWASTAPTQVKIWNTLKSYTRVQSGIISQVPTYVYIPTPLGDYTCVHTYVLTTFSVYCTRMHLFR